MSAWPCPHCGKPLTEITVVHRVHSEETRTYPWEDEFILFDEGEAETHEEEVYDSEVFSVDCPHCEQSLLGWLDSGWHHPGGGNMQNRDPNRQIRWGYCWFRSQEEVETAAMENLL